MNQPKYKILDSKWYSNATTVLLSDIETAQIGIVAIKSNTHEPDDVLEWKAYIGLSSGIDQESDEQRVAMLGSPLSPEQAAGFFPQLPIGAYKAY